MKAVTAKKRLGQHFLIDLSIAKRIADRKKGSKLSKRKYWFLVLSRENRPVSGSRLAEASAVRP